MILKPPGKGTLPTPRIIHEEESKFIYGAPKPKPLKPQPKSLPWEEFMLSQIGRQERDIPLLPTDLPSFVSAINKLATIEELPTLRPAATPDEVLRWIRDAESQLTSAIRAKQAQRGRAKPAGKRMLDGLIGIERGIIEFGRGFADAFREEFL